MGSRKTDGVRVLAGRGLRTLPVLVLAGGLLFTGVLAVATQRAAVAEQRRLEQELLLRAGGAIQAALDEDIRQLAAVAGLVQVVGPVSEAELRSFVAALPPAGSDGKHRAPAFVGRREPPSAAPGTRAAMERAASSGRPSLGGEPEPTVLAVPVSAKASGAPLIGWALAPTDGASLVARGLERLGEEEWLGDHLRITAASPGTPGPRQPAGDTVSRSLELAGGSWTLSLDRAALEAAPAGGHHRLWPLLAGGLGASVVAALLSRALVRSHLSTRAALAMREEAARERALASMVFEASRLGIVVSDPQGRILMVNDAFSRLSGYRPVEVLGRHTNLLRSGCHGQRFYAQLWNELLRDGHWQGDLWNRLRSGELRRHHLSIATVRGDDHRPLFFIGMLEDITERYAAEQSALHQARHDRLTGLGNRALLMEQLERDLALARRHHWAVALLYVDLDGFKAVNDRYGHALGDRVLQRMARRFRAVLRRSDLLCRQGGDEFVVVVPHAGEEGELLQIAAKLIEASEAPLTELNLELTISASVGIACYPRHAHTAEQLLAAADRAMYAAKQQQGGCARIATRLPG